ncbi:DUF6049 family protein [Actinomyces dentalis]|uniref:DUF6049 family protein n=1 Tax=Actinomyces dentalis TaxID=272548 RepID=UPI0028E1A666|nr:DUF6049 family protein [Actinomyces dentalis]
MRARALSGIAAIIGCLVLVLAPVALLPAPLGPTAAALPAADAPPADGRVSVSVDSLAPEVLASGQDLQISGTIVNGTDEPLESVDLVVQVQRSTEIALSGLESWLADEGDAQLSTAITAGLSSIEPGATTTFAVTVPAKDLPLSGSAEWGPRGVQVSVTEDGQSLARDRTIVVWDAGVAVSPTRVTVVVPVVASPAEMNLLAQGDKADPAAVKALRTRVEGLLALARPGVVLAVDPALMTALGAGDDLTSPKDADGAGASPTPAPATEPPATEPDAEPTAELAPATGPTPTAPPATGASPAPDRTLAGALEAAGRSGNLIVLPWADADVSALAHLDEGDLTAGAFTRADETVAAWKTGSTATALTSGPLDAETLALLPQTVSTVIARPGDLPVAEDLTYAPAGITTVDDRVVLVPEASVSEAAAGILSTGSDSTALCALDARGLLRGQLAILTRQTPYRGRDIVVALDRADAAAADPAELGARLEAILASSWTQGRDLGAVVADAREQQSAGEQVQRDELPEQVLDDAEPSGADLNAATQAANHLKSIGSVLADPQALLSPATDVVATSLSTLWRTDPRGRTAHIARARAAGDVVVQSLTAAPSSTINVISATADLPLRIVSSLDQAATVRVHLVPSSTRLQIDHDVTVTVPAQGQTTVLVPIKAVGSGDVDLSIELLAADGTAVGTPMTMRTRVRASWETVGTRVAAGLLVALLAGGITRTVRRGRRQDKQDRRAAA